MRLPAMNYDVVNAARRVVESALGVVPGERIAIVVDQARHELAVALEEIAKSVGASVEVFTLEECAPRPLRHLPDAIVDALGRAQASVALFGYGDGERAMRLELLALVKTLSLRHAHMVGITARSMVPGFSVDPARILDATRAVRMRIRPDSQLTLRSPAGSDLVARLDPRYRWVEQTGSVRPGRWENLPAGKIHTSPARVDGVFAADASVGEHFGATAGLLTSTPVVLEIEASVCKSVRCVDRSLQREVEAHLKRDPNGDRVGTITLGTNVGLLAPSGEIVCDLNLPGLHVNFGTPLPDQTGATWTSRSQLGTAGALGDVDLDGAPLLRAGRYLVG
jgi:leucyl aminopeptidase (aminopeptidase T)